MIHFKSRRQKLIAAGLTLVWLIFISVIILGTKVLIRKEKYEKAAALTGGDPSLGLVAMERYGCAACHHVPGLNSTRPAIGPSLTRLGDSEFLSRISGDDPEKLIQWIINPAAVDPGAKMPNVGVTEADARNIAAYLYSHD